MTLAGCANPSAEQAPEAPGGSQYVDPDGDYSVDRPSLPRDPPLPGERTLEEVPVWRLGEWWQYRVQDQFTGLSRDVLRIVAGTEFGNYLVGFPADAFSNDVLVLHVPGYGDIKADDISYSAHDVPYVPLQFPLREGDSWTTFFESEGNELTFVVDSTDNQTAQLSASGGQGAGTFTYDAEVGEITRWISPGYADYEIVDHGYNYTGLVRVPHDHDLVFFHGRTLLVNDVSAPFIPDPASFEPKTPDEFVEIDGGYDRLSFAIILLDVAGAVAGGLAQVGTAAGVYQITATAPDGTVYEDTLHAGDGMSIKVTFFGHDNPVGTWSIRAIAGGAGAALLEGIGYHSIEIDMPSGCVADRAGTVHHPELKDC